MNSPDNGNSIMQSTVVTPAGKGGNCAASAGIATCTVVVLISSLRLNLSASPATMRDPGDLSSYTFIVTNTGQYPLTGVHLTSTGFIGTGAATDLSGCTAAAGRRWRRGR